MSNPVYIKDHLYPFLPTEGERIEMGGIIDPGKGALLYRKTTETSLQSTEGSEYQRKRVRKITDETKWISSSQKQPLIPVEEDIEIQPWHDEEVEQNPLYSSSDYVSDFNNPLYFRQMAATEAEAIAASESFGMDDRDTTPLAPKEKERGRAARGRPGPEDHGREYMEYLSTTPGLGTVDTLF